MNLKKRVPKKLFASVTALSLCLLLTMTGCGASSSYSAAQEMRMDTSAAPAPAPAAAPRAVGKQAINPSTAGNDMEVSTNADTMQPDIGGPGAGEPDAATTTQRKLVKNADMSLETKEFDTAIPALIELVESMGGYVENQSVDGKSMQNQGEYYERSAYITARVPADKLSQITAQVGTLCNISSQSESIDDITDRYYDAEAHLEMLQVQETRLLELLAKAETLENIIQLEQALTNCQYEIESLSGQLRRMDSQVSYSTLRLNVNEVVDYTVPQEKPKNFVERLGEAFGRSGKNLARATESILFFLIVDGPVLAIYLLFWGAIVYLVYRIWRKRRIKRSPAQPTHLSPTVPEDRPENPEKQ